MAKHDKRVKYQSEADRPVMLSLRIPPDLYERLERYAKAHRQPVSELVRDGIEMRLEVEADPRSRKAGSTTEEELHIDGASILREIQTTLARYEARFQAIERQTTPGTNGQYDSVSYPVIHSHTAIEPAREPAGQEQAAEQEPAYDTSKFYLGKLCPRSHDYEGTGQSLRDKKRECLECKRERMHTSRSKVQAATA